MDIIIAIAECLFLESGIANMDQPSSGLKYDVEVTPQGRVEVSVPFPAGSHVTVYVRERGGDEFADWCAASESSLDFWDNPLDDEDWNNAVEIRPLRPVT